MKIRLSPSEAKKIREASEHHELPVASLFRYVLELPVAGLKSSFPELRYRQCVDEIRFGGESRISGDGIRSTGLNFRVGAEERKALEEIVEKAGVGTIANFARERLGLPLLLGGRLKVAVASRRRRRLRALTLLSAEEVTRIQLLELRGQRRMRKGANACT